MGNVPLKKGMKLFSKPRSVGYKGSMVSAKFEYYAMFYNSTQFATTSVQDEANKKRIEKAYKNRHKPNQLNRSKKSATSHTFKGR